MSVQSSAMHVRLARSTIRPWRSRYNRTNFALAYGLVSLSGLCMGLLMGWIVWG
jgi:hypothetical protein